MMTRDAWDILAWHHYWIICVHARVFRLRFQNHHHNFASFLSNIKIMLTMGTLLLYLISLFPSFLFVDQNV
jgi:hypothetical protein